MNCFGYVAKCFKKLFGDGTDAIADQDFEKVLKDRAIFDDKTADFRAGRYTLRCGDIVKRTGHAGWATGAGKQVQQYGYKPDVLPDVNWVENRQKELGQKIGDAVKAGILPSDAKAMLANGILTDTNKNHENVKANLKKWQGVLGLSDADLKQYDKEWKAWKDANDSLGFPGEYEASLDQLEKNRADRYQIFSPKDRTLLKPCCCARMSLYWETKGGLESDGMHFIHIKSTPDGAYHGTHFKLSWADESGPHTQEWDAVVFYREGSRSYTGLLKNGFLSELMIPPGNEQSRIADAERASGLEFVEPPHNLLAT